MCIPAQLSATSRMPASGTYEAPRVTIVFSCAIAAARWPMCRSAIAERASSVARSPGASAAPWRSSSASVAFQALSHCPRSKQIADSRSSVGR